LKLSTHIDKVGTAGLFLTAILSPCCFPLFALVASAIGLGSFEIFGGWTMWIFQAMVLVSVAGFYLSYRKHRKSYPLALAILSGLSVVYGYHFNESDHWIYFLYAGMLGLLVATGWNYQIKKRHASCINETIELRSTITCPNCGHKKMETMPTDACTYFYECENCKTRLQPLQGDCCVYCSYGTVKCPPMQTGAGCC
jgi:hypothetical protein